MQIGSLADWVSGVGTAGSLLLGFTILWRDRQKSDSAEATQVVAWFVNQPDGNVELRIINGADRPIVNVTFSLACTDPHGKMAALWKINNIAAVLESGESTSLSLPFREFHANALYPSYIQFRDSNGANWRRNIRSGKLRRAKVGLYWRRRLVLMKSPKRAITSMKVSYRMRR